MHDVLSTIQADQDSIIRAAADTPLVVDGGPGTGKTVVALHRAAYLLYSDPGIASGGGLLFVGPNPAYLSYVDDVLPRLGEDGVRLCTLDDLVPETAAAHDDAPGLSDEDVSWLQRAEPEIGRRRTFHSSTQPGVVSVILLT